MSLAKYVHVNEINSSGKKETILADCTRVKAKKGMFFLGEVAILIPEGYAAQGQVGPALLKIEPGHKYGRDLDVIIGLQEAGLPELLVEDITDEEEIPEEITRAIFAGEEIVEDE